MKVQKIFRSPKNLLVAICFVVVFFPSTVFGFAPSDLSNLSLWLKADSLGLTDGASVSSWTDSSGNNHNATQVTTNAQPIFKTNILGGKPVIRFDGINDELSESLSVSNTNYTVFLVAKSTASAGSFHIAVGYGNGSDGTLWMGQFNSTNEITISGSSLANDLKTNADPAANHIYSVVANGGALYGYVDGSSAGVGGALGNRPSDYLTLGSYSNDGLPWQGDIAEVIVYNSSLSDSDRQQVENYLNTKYASNTAPVVTMTSPGQGNTVKGAVTLSATASDDVSVSGVQFKLDTNTLIGSEITSAPYTMSWNSTGVPNGGHTLSAVARDGSGAYATSTINITVKQSHGSSAARAIVTSSNNFVVTSSSAVSTLTLPILPSNTSTTTSVPVPVQDLAVAVPFSGSITVPTASKSFNKNLQFGMIDADVILFQKYLNAHGYIVSTTGAGSVGNETNKFGLATKSALIKFQQANNIRPASGYFGVLTRAKVNESF